MASTSAAAFCLHRHEQLYIACTLILNLQIVSANTIECRHGASNAISSFGVRQQAIAVTKSLTLK